MKKRWRSKSRRKSSGPASPSRSGESTSPCRSGESASPDRSGDGASSASAGPDRQGGRSGEGSSSASAAPDREGRRSGEGGSSASAAPDREGEDERMQHQRGDGSPSPGEETAVRPKLRQRGSPPSSLVRLSYKGWSGTVPSSMASEVQMAVDAEERKKLAVDAEERKKLAEERKKWLKKQRKKEKRREKNREKEKQCLSVRCEQHDALFIEESSMTSEQQQHKTSSLLPNPSLISDRFSDLQDAGEASVISLSGEIKGKDVRQKAWQRKISPSDSTQISNVGGVPGNVQEAARTSASPPAEEESIKQNDDAILNKGCLDDAELLMDQSALLASHSSSQSEDAQEEVPFDGEETSLQLKMNKKSEPSCSGDFGKIAQDEDGHSDQKPCSVIEDEHFDEIGVHAIEDHEQEQGRAVRHVQALLDMDNHTISEMIYHCLRQFNYHSPEVPFDWSEYEPQQLTELYQRLALYRIRGYDYELSVDRKLAKLDDATLAKDYPPSVLYDEGYFEHYEDSLEWYFDPELCKHAGFEDYQRLVLRNNGDYRDWDCYTSTPHTYEEDLAYVEYCKAIEKETKWIDDYLVDSSIPWEKIENVAHLVSLKIAACFPNVSPSLVSTSFKEHMWSVLSDFENYKGLDVVYFEIWKRVAKQKMDFIEALSEIHREKMFPLRSFDIEQELENPQRRWSMKDKYDAYVACIGDLVSDDQARPLIAEAVKKMSSKSKNVDYARKKLEIAKEIGLITKERSTEVARQ